MMETRVHILPSGDIDHNRWNDCIARHANGLIYSTTAFLDAMATNWHGIVIGDYQSVMPLPWRRKFGFRYSYMPAFLQQTGISGEYDAKDAEDIFRLLPGFVSLADIHFNFSNTELRRDAVATRTNYTLDLHQTEDAIAQRYKKQLLDNIRKAESRNVSYVHGADAFAVTALYRSLYGERMRNISGNDHAHFAALADQWLSSGKCIIRLARANNGDILAAVLLLRDTRRLYHVMNAVSPAGRKSAANHWLLHRVIAEFAGTGMLFDFEGSDLPGVKQFYECFGAVNQPYFQYRYNGLPIPFRWLVKRSVVNG